MATVFNAAVVVICCVLEVVDGRRVELVVGRRHDAPDLNSTASLRSVQRSSNALLGPSSSPIRRALANGAYVTGVRVLKSE